MIPARSAIKSSLGVCIFLPCMVVVPPLSDFSLDCFLENVLDVTPSVSTTLLGIAPRAQGNFVSIEQGQRLLCVLTGQGFLSIGQVYVGEVVHGVSRVGIGDLDDSQDFNRGLEVALALVVEADDAG